MVHVSKTDVIGDEVKQVILEELRRFNLENNGEFFADRELPANAPRPLYVVARDDEARVLGGLIAETQFAWLKVAIMAVAPHARRQGVGSRLLAAAEMEAADRGCRFAYADTMDYHAPGFYLKLGYQTAGKLDDWDSHGHSKFFFSKGLVRQE